MKGVSQMEQSIRVIDSDQSKSPNKWPLILLILSAIADWISITTFVAIYVKQDPLLILLMLVAAAIIAGITYWVIRIIRPPLLLVLIVFIGSVMLAIVAWSLLASSEVTPLEVNITDPQDGGSVTRPDQGYLVKGTVSDPNASVYVIVRTLPAPEMWVQQPAIVGGEGKWHASVYFGDKIISPGERYEVIALATNDNFLVTCATGNSLSQGDNLLSLPRKSNKSSLITVTRPR
jgi:hypothetical protein